MFYQKGKFYDKVISNLGFITTKVHNLTSFFFLFCSSLDTYRHASRWAQVARLHIKYMNSQGPGDEVSLNLNYALIKANYRGGIGGRQSVAMGPQIFSKFFLAFCTASSRVFFLNPPTTKICPGERVTSK